MNCWNRSHSEMNLIILKMDSRVARSV